MSKLVKEKECWLVELREYETEIWRTDIEVCSREEAIKLGKEYAKQEGLNAFYVGRKVQCDIPTIFADDVVDNVQCQLYGDVGEISDDYLEDVTKEQKDELEEKINEVFFEWHKKYNLWPGFYKVEDEEKINVK